MTDERQVFAPVKDEPVRSECEEIADKIKDTKMDAHIDMLRRMARGGRPCDGCDD
jgi:hypothetical protein